MPRRPELDRPVPLKLMLPESERARLDLHLFSPLEGRVPQGAYQTFFRELMRQFFEWRQAELYPGGHKIFGSPAAIEEAQTACKVWSELSSKIGCSSSDGSAELAKVDLLQER